LPGALDKSQSNNEHRSANIAHLALVGCVFAQNLGFGWIHWMNDKERITNSEVTARSALLASSQAAGQGAFPKQPKTRRTRTKSKKSGMRHFVIFWVNSFQHGYFLICFGVFKLPLPRNAQKCKKQTYARKQRCEVGWFLER
jgi:hypothetical protein